MSSPPQGGKERVADIGADAPAGRDMVIPQAYTTDPNAIRGDDEQEGSQMTGAKLPLIDQQQSAVMTQG